MEYGDGNAAVKAEDGQDFVRDYLMARAARLNGVLERCTASYKYDRGMHVLAVGCSAVLDAERYDEWKRQTYALADRIVQSGDVVIADGGVLSKIRAEGRL